MTTQPITHDPTVVDDDLAREAIELAQSLLEAAKEQQTAAERQQAAKLAGMMDDPDGKKLTMLLPDQAFRSHNPTRVADQIRYLTQKYGVPDYFLWWEQAALMLGNLAGNVLPSVVVPMIVSYLRQETNTVILPSEEAQFRSYLQKRRADHTRLNVNQLGEAILGEGEAARRFKAYLDLLARPDIEYISVKISSIFSQIHMVAFEHTVEQIKERLRKLFRQAMKHQFRQPDGTMVSKFVNLDMEEYRDLHLTVEAFQQVLDEDEFLHYRAGIVLQAYLPDSSQVQRDLTQWAIERHARGGATIKMRLVKGANLAMEKVEAAIHGWEQAPYYTKSDVDANFKRMVQYAFTPERASVVNIGIASHNLFDITYALLLREKMGVTEYVEFEMLEGMANHQARAVQEKAGGLLLYAPVVKREDFHSAIAYLVRRLDENTAEENFLRDLFGLEPGSPTWNKQRDLFLTAVEKMHTVSDKPNRQQDRSTEEINFDPNEPFHNEPDTDFSLRQNQRWIKAIMQDWEARTIEDIPLQINGEFIQTERKAEGIDPAKPREVSHRYALAQPGQIERALQTAVNAKEGWQKKSIAERKALLVRAAEFLANRRGDFLGAMARDGGKTVEQSDPEVSEAIDFANYYARSFDLVESELQDLTYQPLGVVLITPPWNFPMAIPAGGVLAALMAGNTVLFKPAPEATLVGWHIANALWDAGIPKDVLQFVPTTDDAVGKALVTDERVDAVILTGAYETARMFLSWKPKMRLFAETSGKNSMIITAMSDRDQAVKDLVKSAFGHAGQKCSASSLAILEAEVYEDQAFLRQLKDAAESLAVGSAWNLETVINPLIHAPEGKLQRALTQLDEGESWLLEPKMVGDNPNCWSPGIKLGVKPGSFYHQTECFGPVLGLIRADNLEHAIKIANDVDYGLTSGLHSLDDREIAIWREKIEAGNAYINRGTTGAIVQRQSFGGWKQSAFGYAKAGGPNYTLSLGTWADASDEKLLERAKKSYQHAWDTHFSKEHDPSNILGESNVFRYRRIRRMILRVTPNTKAVDIERVALGAQVAGVALRISLEPGVKLEKTVRGNVTVVTEDESVFLTTLQDKPFRYWQRVRVTEPVSDAVYQVAHEAHVPIIDAPVVSNGRIELRHYFVEQAMTQTMHRYGNLL